MIEFKASELKDVIGKCARFSSTTGIIPEFGYLAIRDGFITAFNGYIGIKYRNPISISEEFILPAETFSRSLYKVEDSTVNLIKKKDEVLFKSRRFKAKLPNPPNEYTIIIDVPGDDMKKPIPEGFSDSLNQLLFSVPKDDKAKESLKGIYYDGEKFYASDNIKLSRFTPNFKLEKDLFIPAKLLEHLIEDKPLAYYLSDNKLWFWFENYVIFGVANKITFPMGKNFFDDKLSKKDESVIVSVDRELLNAATERIAIYAELYMNRMNVVALLDEIVLYAYAPSGVEAIEVLKATSNITPGDQAGFVSVDLNFFKEEVERASDFFFTSNTSDFVYFSNNTGLESILKPLAVEDGAEIIERIANHLATIRSDSDSTGVDSNSGRTESQQA